MWRAVDIEVGHVNKLSTALLGAVLFGAVLAGCSGGPGPGEPSDGSTAPPSGNGKPNVTTTPGRTAACDTPPVTMRLQARGSSPAGSENFTVTDAVARRVPILPGKEASGSTPLAELAKEAATTDLALYTLFLADYEIPRAELTGPGFGQLVPPAGKTVGALTIVPDSRAGFGKGDVIDGSAAPEDRDFRSITTFAPLGLTVYTDGNTTGQAYSDVTGSVRIVQLTDHQICLDMDVEFTSQDKLIYAAKGVVASEVVRSADSSFFS